LEALRRDTQVRIVRASDPTQIQVLRHPADVRALSFDPLGQYLVRARWLLRLVDRAPA
jgi:hypothetical protein